MNHVNGLTDDILLDIFQKLTTLADVLKCIRVCKRWKRAVENYGLVHFKTLSKTTIFPALWQESRKKMSLDEGISMLKRCIKYVTHIDFEEVIFSDKSAVIQHMNNEILEILLLHGPRLQQLILHADCLDQSAFNTLTKFQRKKSNNGLNIIIKMDCLAIRTFMEEGTQVVVSFEKVFFSKEKEQVVLDTEQESPSELPVGEKKECLVVRHKNSAQEFVRPILRESLSRRFFGFNNVTFEANGITIVQLFFADQDRVHMFNSL
uniref:F-box domain-containing protein n=1 Tax=Ditylenchus dipsaci TaxID=166011 RepID=A0A915ELS7_9BILA